MSRGSRHENEGRTKAGTYSAGQPYPRSDRVRPEAEMSGNSSHGHHHHCHLCAGSQEPKFSPSPFTSSSQQPCPSSHFQVGNQASELKGLQSHTAASGGRLHPPGTWHRKSAPARNHSVCSGDYVNVCRCFPQNHYNKQSGA